MIRLQDIADMAGVSRTTVSNVINGNTKRVSQETIDRVTKILKEQEYEPQGSPLMLAGQGTKTIGVVLGYAFSHGIKALQDFFIGEFLGAVKEEAEKNGYYIMLIGGEYSEYVVDIASRWNMEGLIIFGYSETQYKKLYKKLNKKMILIDTYPEKDYTFQNVGIDDYSGGYQVGEYLYSCGYKKALFVAETAVATDYYRFCGFKQAMEKEGKYCSKSRFIVVPFEFRSRLRKYEELLPRFLQARAVAFSSDYSAIEAMNFFYDHQIQVPEQISVVGFDDSMYAEFVRPRLTTVHQDVSEKGKIAVRRLMKMIRGEPLPEMNIKRPVWLVKRDSVRE